MTNARILTATLALLLALSTSQNATAQATQGAGFEGFNPAPSLRHQALVSDSSAGLWLAGLVVAACLAALFFEHRGVTA
jgi:hypothetical protein